MRIPRVTLELMMLATGLLAIDLAGVVNLLLNQVWPEFWAGTVIGLPLFNMLAIAGYAVVKRRELNGFSREFLVGFVLSSFVLLLCVIRLSIYFPEAGGSLPPDISGLVFIGLIMAFCTVPQLMIAAIGGAIYARVRRRS